jgi:peptide/nickel transport system substrate-binding protein
MKVVDDLTLELTMSKPWSTFPNALVGKIGNQLGYIAAPKMLASPDGGRNPIGTGPFKFTEWVPDDHVTVARNDSYWQQPAWLDTIVFKPIPDPTARKAAMDAGDIDVYYTGNTSEITAYQALQKDGKFSVTIGAPSDPDCIMFNTKQAPTDDVRVRRAIVMATDMSRIFDYLDATGVKQLTHGPYADTSFWYTKSNYPDFDLAGAKQLVDEYTKEKGPITIEFAGGQSPFIVGLQELYQSMWKDAGINVKIVSRAQAENISAVVGGKFQVILWGGIGGGDPDDDYNDFHTGTGLNFSGFGSPEVDAALDKGRTLTDSDARKEQYAILQKALGDQIPFLWAGTNQFGVITKPSVQGMGTFTLPDASAGQAISGGQIFLKDVWLKP